MSRTAGVARCICASLRPSSAWSDRDPNFRYSMMITTLFEPVHSTRQVTQVLHCRSQTKESQRACVRFGIRSGFCCLDFGAVLNSRL